MLREPSPTSSPHFSFLLSALLFFLSSLPISLSPSSPHFCFLFLFLSSLVFPTLSSQESRLLTSIPYSFSSPHFYFLLFFLSSLLIPSRPPLLNALSYSLL
uniref:Uncharacterized protein n=1 Tax=Cacopsylla melanoneura TaxID=428564 RepID=A0A8D8VT34_9HEMI